jgi:hypothetical protein
MTRIAATTTPYRLAIGERFAVPHKFSKPTLKNAVSTTKAVHKASGRPARNWTTEIGFKSNAGQLIRVPMAEVNS